MAYRRARGGGRGGGRHVRYVATRVTHKNTHSRNIPTPERDSTSPFRFVHLNLGRAIQFKGTKKPKRQFMWWDAFVGSRGGTFTAHSNKNAAHDIGAGFRIDDTFKGSDYLDGRHFARASALYDMKLTQDGKLRGWIQEVHGNKQENAFTGVFTLERQGDVKPNFVSRFNKIKNATNA